MPTSKSASSPRSTRTVVRAVLSAFQDHDLEAFCAELDRDARLVDVVSEKTATGADSIVDAVRPTLLAFPDLEVEVVSLTVEGERAVAELMRRGTHTGPLHTPQGELPPTNRRARMPEVIVMEVAHGKVVEMRVYVDLHDVTKQLGVSA